MILSRRNAILVSIVLFVALGVVIWTMRSKSVVEEYVAQLHARGEPFYFSDLPAPRMTNGTPGLDQLVRAGGQLSTFGIDAMDIIKPGRARVTWAQPKVHEYGATNRDIGWSQFRQKLQANESLIAAVRQSVEHPEPDMGWATNIYVFRRTALQERLAAQALAADAIGALHEGDHAKALKDIEALAHMSQLERDDLMLVSQMMRLAVASLGLSVTWDALQADGWTDEQLASLQRALTDAELISALERGLIGVRIFGLVHMKDLRAANTNAVAGFFGSLTSARVTWQKEWVIRLWSATIAEQDELYILQTMQKFIEDARLVRHGTPLHEVNRIFQADMTNVQSSLSRSDFIWKHPLAGRSIPNFQRVAELCIHYEVQRRLTIAAVAIARYRMRYQRLPETLQVLVPEFCSEVPVDPMDYKPLRYHPDAEGNFTLYSVGDNGLDDHGDPAPPKGQATNMASGLDIVWPRPAKSRLCGD